MGIIQNILGKKTEEAVADFFGEKGYWAHILPKAVIGQPFDIIARRENKVFFVDAKHLEDKKASFALSRIEPNQLSAMKYANMTARIFDNMGFVIMWKENFYFLDYGKVKYMIAKDIKSIKMEELPLLERFL